MTNYKRNSIQFNSIELNQRQNLTRQLAFQCEKKNLKHKFKTTQTVNKDYLYNVFKTSRSIVNCNTLLNLSSWSAFFVRN